jgi:hypothetical protein
LKLVRHVLVLLAVLAIIVAALRWPPIPQDPAYHNFADQRTLLGVPNCLNVLSNLPFAVVGFWGLLVIFARKPERVPLFADPWERWPYGALFAGTLLTAFGSSYYHLAPDDARLVWDRLPMTVGFMGLLSAVIAERASATAGRWLFGPRLSMGAASVLYWRGSEFGGRGDLRPYAVVQFGSLLVMVLLILLYRGRYAGTRYLISALSAYLIAKGFEAADRGIFALGHLISGHSMKHVAAAGGVAFVVLMLRARSRHTIAPNVMT